MIYILCLNLLVFALQENAPQNDDFGTAQSGKILNRTKENSQMTLPTQPNYIAKLQGLSLNCKENAMNLEIETNFKARQKVKYWVFT